MLELSAIFMLMTFAVFVVYGLFAAAVRDHIISRPPRVLTWMRRTFCGGFRGARREARVCGSVVIQSPCGSAPNALDLLGHLADALRWSTQNRSPRW